MDPLKMQQSFEKQLLLICCLFSTQLSLLHTGLHRFLPKSSSFRPLGPCFRPSSVENSSISATWIVESVGLFVGVWPCKLVILQIFYVQWSYSLIQCSIIESIFQENQSKYQSHSCECRYVQLRSPIFLMSLLIFGSLLHSCCCCCLLEEII